MYPPEMTEPMRAELRRMGVTECTTPEAVDAALAKPGTTLLVINSVCGCAAGGARPGVGLALAQAQVKPDQAVTVFAGVDRSATDRARSHLAGYPPSSPSIAIFKDGEPVWMLHRHQIEGSRPEQIAQALVTAFQSV